MKLNYDIYKFIVNNKFRNSLDIISKIMIYIIEYYIFF